MHGCTIVAKNYLPFARVLARSFRCCNPGSEFSVLIIDRWEGYIEPSQEPFNTLSIEDVGVPGFESMVERYSILELSTAVKPWLLRHLLQQEGAGAVLYLDPDIKVFSPLDELETLAVQHGAVLIPHFTQPPPRDGRWPTDMEICRAGTYNLGFIGVSDAPWTGPLLDWWGSRLQTECLLEPFRGYFVDQKWMDLLPGMHDVAIVRDPGYNVAYWNLHYREVSRHTGGYEVNGKPLRFFHFSGYSPLAPKQLSKYQDRIRLRRRPVLWELFESYREDLEAAGFAAAQGWPYEPLGSEMPAGPRSQPDTPSVGPAAEVADSPGSEGASDGRSLARRTGDLMDLIEVRRREGVGRIRIAREVAAAVRPWRNGRIGFSGAGRRGSAFPRAPREAGVNVVGYLQAETGVGELGRQTIRALEASGVPVCPIVERAGRSRNEEAFDGGVGVDQAPYSTNLICVNADQLPSFRATVGEEFFAGRYSVGFWSWEVQAFPAEYLPAFDLVDEVWVGSRHTREGLEGLSDTPVTCVTYPVCPEPVGTDEVQLGEGFSFLFMFDYLSVFERKNPLGLVSAFAEAFAPGGGASLSIKCINSGFDPENHKRLLEAVSRHPDISLVEGFFTAGEKNAMLKNCDCYVSLHRAEGFGFTLAEAMYYGRPVIATGYSGNLDFMTKENSRLVDYGLTEIGPGAAPYPAQGTWGEPDLGHAAELMLEVFENPEQARVLGSRAAGDIRRTHSLEAAGEGMRDQLAATAGLLGI